jgi:hypothetical protein
VTVAVLAAMTFLKRISVILRKMERIVGISETADEPGVSISTCAARGWGLRANWWSNILPGAKSRRAVAYRRLSSHDEEVNLERQGGLLTDRTGTSRKISNVWPQALRCQPVEKSALARFASGLVKRGLEELGTNGMGEPCAGLARLCGGFAERKNSAKTSAHIARM